MLKCSNYFQGFALLAVLWACTGREQPLAYGDYDYGESLDSLVLEVKTAFGVSINAFNNHDLRDSTDFAAFRSFYDSTFTVFGSPGSPAVSGMTVFDSLQRYVRDHDLHIYPSIDRIDVSGQLAYVLYHYRQTATDTSTGAIVHDGTRSACMILRKDGTGAWRCVALTWSPLAG